MNGLNFLIYSSFGSLLAVFLLLQVLFHRGKFLSPFTSGSNPTFLTFQRSYLYVYFLAVGADWLQSPYLYKLYSYYGFLQSQIAILYVCGLASSVVVAIYGDLLADKYGRRRICIVGGLVYAFSCVLKLSRSYLVLLLGRILAGISSPLMFTALESWYIHEHRETHDFPIEWIGTTFSKAMFWSGVIAVASGVVTDFVADVLNFGPVSPFIIAALILIAVVLWIASNWKENLGSRKISLKAESMEGLKLIVTSRRVLLMGAVQSLFESVMCIFIFLWTPIIDSEHRPPLGLAFATFMLCTVLGSALFDWLTSRQVAVYHSLNLSLLAGALSMLCCSLTSDPAWFSPSLSYLAFLVMEVACGLYFPAMSRIRSHLLPEAQRVRVVSWFRVPLNLIACLVLMWLHGHESKMGERNIFFASYALLGLSLVCGLHFGNIVRDDNSF